MLIYVICWPLLAWIAGRLIPAIGNGDIDLVINLISQALLIFLIQKIAQYIQDINGKMFPMTEKHHNINDITIQNIIDITISKI